MKSFINNRSTLVTDAIDGFLLSSTNGNLARLDGYPDIKVVVRADWNKDAVAVISGGGSGHEPAHAGFVGAGMLTAAVCGEVFASPSVDAVFQAIIAVTGDPGCLLIVKNYTGDRLNFGLAAERAKARGLKVEMVIVSDDIALPDLVNPRGLAGTLFVHKIAGAKAATGATLEDVYQAAADAALHTRSIGLSLTTCHIPGSAENGKQLGEHDVEIGLGIHGEPGAATIKLQPADALVTLLADRIDSTLAEGDRVAVMINSLGGTSQLELGIIAHALTKTGLFRRTDYIVGPCPLMTALDMRGFSLSALVLNPERSARLIQATDAVAWPGAAAALPIAIQPLPVPTSQTQTTAVSDDSDVRKLILAATQSLRQHAARIDALDAKVGDGDTGSTLAHAAENVLSGVDAMPLADGTALLHAIAERLLRAAGGSSGVLLAILFTAASQVFAKSGNWAAALRAGLDQVKLYGGAKLGDRTMIDALEPALDALVSGASLAEAAEAARAGADGTALLSKAGAGRSVYVPSSALRGVADPGAEAVAALFGDLARSA